MSKKRTAKDSCSPCSLLFPHPLKEKFKGRFLKKGQWVFLELIEKAWKLKFSKVLIKKVKK